MCTMNKDDPLIFSVDLGEPIDPRDKQIEDLQDLVYFYKQIIRKLTKDDK